MNLWKFTKKYALIYINSDLWAHIHEHIFAISNTVLRYAQIAMKKQKFEASGKQEWTNILTIFSTIPNICIIDVRNLEARFQIF